MKPRIFTIILSAAIALAVQSCGVFGQSSAEPNEAVLNASPSSGIYVSVNTIMGKIGQPVHSIDGYYIQIKDGKAYSYLPFFGESYYSAGYGKSSGIEFDGCPVSIVESQTRHTRVWSFNARQDQETVEVTIEFSESGGATVTCRSSRRSMMRYLGDVTTPPVKK